MFDGNRRFKLLRQLGAGGMGVVYEALDQQRGTRVALKTLRETDADLLYRLKREFRGLRDLVHRNLVGLDELFEEDGHWFFTMELVDGEDLRTYFHRIAWAPAADDATAPLAPPNAFEATWPGPAAAEVADLGDQPRATDFDRVRDVFGQIARGLLAIHEAGKIHRDIKPSNVIVARDGRVVILDFGLVTEQWGAGRSDDGKIVGTLMYMAPEQAAGQAAAPAADWFSVGIMLYEVLTGQSPFAGPWGAVLAAKQRAGPTDPRELNASCPEDLAALCVELLQLDPLRRPRGAEVPGRLGAGARDAPAAASRLSSAPPHRLFVGREAELRELRRALDDVDAGAAITVFVHGESGIGKSTLIHHFADAAPSERGGAVVLAGQCREHEAVPFKAVDGVIDALSRHVCRLSEVAAAELVPPHAALLSAVFPVLGRIPAVAKAPRPHHAASDPFQQRKRVFTALRDMLGLLAERSRLICVIDDMQWADSDSLHLLEELLRPPDPPRMLLLASFRSSDEAPALPQLPGEVRRVRLRPLDPRDSARLAGLLLERLAPEQQAQTARIADETGGHPLFIGELVRHAAAEHGAAVKPLRLDEAIWDRVSQLDAAPVRVLEVLAMAVAPLPEELLRAATTLDASAVRRSVSLLRATHLVRGASPTAALEVYHDRVRQAVVHHLDEAARTALHERLAAALETSGAHLPPEQLIHHLRGARQLEQAARKALEAADRARAGLAFEQASQLYEVALGVEAWSEAERREILLKLGEVLASAGRCPDAARAYESAAEGADPLTQLSCRIQVADQLLQSGYLEKGAALLFSLFREHGHELPSSPSRLALRMMWYRARLAARGLRFTERSRSEIEPADQALLALYKAAARGLVMIDPMRAGYFVLRGRLLAMSIGDRDFVMYFALMEIAFRTAGGSKQHAAFLETAHELVREHQDPLFQAFRQSHSGVLTYLRVDREFEEAFEVLARSDDELTQAAHAATEQNFGRYFLICCLHKIGDFVRLRSYTRRFLREAEQRGNLYARTTINRRSNILWLADDEPAGAREDLETDSWVSYAHGYHIQHWLELNARVDIAVYEGSPVDREFLAQHLQGLERSSLQRILDFRCETDWLLGRMALAGASPLPSPQPIVRRSIARLLSYRTHYSTMLARMLRATLAVQTGDLDGAARDFREVVTMGEAAHIRYLTAAARRRLGALVGGDEGRELAAAAERWMREAGIKDADRMTYLVSPCRLDPGGR